VEFSERILRRIDLDIDLSSDPSKLRLSRISIKLISQDGKSKSKKRLFSSTLLCNGSTTIISVQ
jgi:hypothetical protein